MCEPITKRHPFYANLRHLFRGLAVPTPIEPPKPRRRPSPSHVKSRLFSFFRGRDERQEQRIANRAEKDLHSARMNYPGWCGRPESGELRAA